MHTQTVEAGNWWARPRGANNAQWVQTYQKSLAARHRDAIVEIVKGLPEVKTVLEVGSHCGPNLIRLAQAMPEVEQFSGVDINADAVAAGQRWVASLGLQSRIELAAGRVPDMTEALPTGCVDVVLSCYALAYFAPEDLDAVLWEMGRLAKRALVLAEPMPGGPPRPPQVTDYQEWAHDYQGASKWLNTWRGCTLHTVPVDPPVDRLHSILVAVRGEA
jgi:cyclopropane fatty-acyl-phospholipid synthase-like methyltransferase